MITKQQIESDDGLVESRRSWRRTLFEFCAVAVLLTMIFVPLLWEFQEARSAANQVTCKAHIYQLGSFLLVYEREHGHFPAPVTYDEDGRTMHSWRAEILRSPHDPYVRGYDFSQPWDSPDNLKFARENVPRFVQCPDVERDATTNYLLVIGTDCFYSSTQDQPTMSRLDEASARVPLLVESSESDILWTEPRDIEVAPGVNLSTLPEISGLHQGDAVLLFLDQETGKLKLDWSHPIQ